MLTRQHHPPRFRAKFLSPRFSAYRGLFYCESRLLRDIESELGSCGGSTSGTGRYVRNPTKYSDDGKTLHGAKSSIKRRRKVDLLIVKL